MQIMNYHAFITILCFIDRANVVNLEHMVDPLVVSLMTLARLIPRLLVLQSVLEDSMAALDVSNTLKQHTSKYMH